VLVHLRRHLHHLLSISLFNHHFVCKSQQRDFYVSLVNWQLFNLRMWPTDCNNITLCWYWNIYCRFLHSLHIHHQVRVLKLLQNRNLVIFVCTNTTLPSKYPIRTSVCVMPFLVATKTCNANRSMR